MYVLKKLIDRQKQRFGLPVNEWLRGPLKNWAINLYDKKISRAMVLKMEILPEKLLMNIFKAKKTGTIDCGQF